MLEVSNTHLQEEEVINPLLNFIWDIKRLLRLPCMHKCMNAFVCLGVYVLMRVYMCWYVCLCVYMRVCIYAFICWCVFSIVFLCMIAFFFDICF